MYNNDYTVFPETPDHGDSYQFRGRTYVYNSEKDHWIDASITEEPVTLDYCIDYKNLGSGSITRIVSRKSDIDADAKYNQLAEQKRNRVSEADFYIIRYQERSATGQTQTESLEDIVNYKAAVEAIDNSTDPAEANWPTAPWK